jgi:hypothetical protein
MKTNRKSKQTARYMSFKNEGQETYVEDLPEIMWGWDEDAIREFVDRRASALKEAMPKGTWSIEVVDIIKTQNYSYDSGWETDYRTLLTVEVAR